jgi:hypothetical protein
MRVYLALVVAALGCSDPVVVDSGPKGKPTTKSSASASSTSFLPVLSASAPPSASAFVVAMPSSTAGGEPLRWADFAGPDVAPPSGAKLWAAAPVSAGWDTVHFSLFGVSRAAETAAVVKSTNGEYLVPGAFLAGLEAPQGLVKGDAVIASAHGTRVFARVIEPGETTKIAFRFATGLEEISVPTLELRRLDDTLKFGAPAAFLDKREGEKKGRYRPIAFVSSDGERAWIITSTGKPQRLEAAKVKPLPVAKIHAKGEKVWVSRGDEFTSGLVEDILDQGVRYKVRLEGGDDTTVAYDGVATPLE